MPDAAHCASACPEELTDRDVGEFPRLHCPNSLPALTRLFWKPHHPSPLQEDVDRNLPHQADAAGPSLQRVERRCEEEEQSELPVLLLLFFLPFST